MTRGFCNYWRSKVSIIRSDEFEYSNSELLCSLICRVYNSCGGESNHGNKEYYIRVER